MANRKFNPKTQKWEDAPVDNTPVASNTSSTTDNSKSENSPTEKATVETTKESGKGLTANKEYTESEMSYLTGDASVEPNSVTLNTIAGQTVELCGIGKYLTGMYYVEEVKIDIDTSSGISLTYSVLKNGVGKTLKEYSPSVENTNPNLVATAEPSKTDQTVTNTATLKAGDKVKFIDGENATYANAHDGVRVPSWVKQKTYTISKMSNDNNKALLSEISSWTYVKYLQKA